jgi:hypothetical protein
MANWIERTRYQASWGAWYVQVQFDNGQIVELKFDHNPTNAEIDQIAQQVWAAMQPPEPTIILEAEDETEV